MQYTVKHFKTFQGISNRSLNKKKEKRIDMTVACRLILVLMLYIYTQYEDFFLNVI